LQTRSNHLVHQHAPWTPVPCSLQARPRTMMSSSRFLSSSLCLLPLPSWTPAGGGLRRSGAHAYSPDTLGPASTCAVKGYSWKGTDLPKAIARAEDGGNSSDGNDAREAAQQSDRHDVGQWSGWSDDDGGVEVGEFDLVLGGFGSWQNFSDRCSTRPSSLYEYSLPLQPPTRKTSPELQRLCETQVWRRPSSNSVRRCVKTNVVSGAPCTHRTPPHCVVEQAIRSRARRASASQSTVSPTPSAARQALEDSSDPQTAQIDPPSVTAIASFDSSPASIGAGIVQLPLDSRGLPMWPRAGGARAPAGGGRSSEDASEDGGSGSDSDDVGTRSDVMR
jgi:hypothetical protein